MRDKDTISKGPKRRDETCYQVLQDIVIPAGTILRTYGKHSFEAQIGSCGKFSISDEHRADVPAELYRKVVAA